MSPALTRAPALPLLGRVIRKLTARLSFSWGRSCNREAGIAFFHATFTPT